LLVKSWNLALYKEAEFMNGHWTISLRFLGIILRVLRLEVSVCISSTRDGGIVFYKVPFLLYRNCKRLRDFGDRNLKADGCEKQGGNIL
jgi:hypothetical protein